MASLDKMMERLGYVKLERFGLALTADGRVMSLRPTVLDDGVGNKIVGWEDGDLAAMELEPWEASRSTAAPPRMLALGGRAPVPPAPAPVIAAPAPAPVIAAPAPVIAAPAPAPVIAAPAPAPVIAAPVRATPPAPVTEPPEEEDWEWEIAVARARAATVDKPAIPAPRTAKRMPVVRSPEIDAMVLGEDTTVRAPYPPPALHTMSASRSTVIPIPSMPTIAPDRPSYNPPPVVRGAGPRHARGTDSPVRAGERRRAV